jgi:serine/threonine protein phosphatase 1
MLAQFFKKLCKQTHNDTKGIAFEEAEGPSGVVIVAVGDIHGQLLPLKRLLQKLKEKECAAQTRFIYVFLGDYIDRGPSSFGVVETLLEWSGDRTTTFLSGNHEAFMNEFIHDPVANKDWLQYGGLETLIDYNITLASLSPSSEILTKIRDQFLDNLPSTHKSFFNSLKLSFSTGDFMFAHAGVNPSIKLQDNQKKELLWIREPFLSHKGLYNKVIVHGHSITRDGKPDIRRNRVCLETGSYTRGTITALLIDGQRKTFINSKGN